MIHRIIYIGERVVEDAGKKRTIAVPSEFVLKMQGPMLEVAIMPPKITRETLEKKGEKFPTFKATALIDSGASSSIIRPEIANSLKLVHTGYQKIVSVQDSQDQPIYFGAIGFSWGKAKECPLIACPLTNVDCLIGRDILQHWYLTYDGANGTIVICD